MATPRRRVADVLLWSLLVLALLGTFGCGASLKNTWQQDAAFELFGRCGSAAGGVQLGNVAPDGSFTWVGDSGSVRQVSECVARVRRTPEWQARLREIQAHHATERISEVQKRGSASATAPSTSSRTSTIEGAVNAPEWRIGDEWEYRSQSPSSLSTFVWRMDRTEQFDGTQYYIIRAGSRELYYRAADFALTQETIDGRIVRKIDSGRWHWVSFPLVVGKAWDTDYVESRPVDRQTENIQRRCLVEGTESVTVPAGTFATLRIACFNRRNDAKVFTVWYAPEVRQIVRDVSQQTGGTRTRELIHFTLK